MAGTTGGINRGGEAQLSTVVDFIRCVSYSLHMIEVQQTEEFSRWMRKLKDRRAVARIAMRIERLEAGGLGDVKFFDGIGELRIDYGPGYRVYFAKRGDILIILLCGGDKSSQRRDIARAVSMAKEV